MAFARCEGVDTVLEANNLGRGSGPFQFLPEGATIHGYMVCLGPWVMKVGCNDRGKHLSTLR